jgi:hypothetical protein
MQHSTIVRPVAPVATPATDIDLIACTQCDLVSPFADDADEGMWAAHDAGWHVYDRDECGCPVLCPDCSESWCGIADYTPRLVGMRVA